MGFHIFSFSRLENKREILFQSSVLSTALNALKDKQTGKQC